ncbi:unnamed protein product [Parnassius mnemosyne]|uniref:Uncharacterized protein n=1 Tax=Parnassius mnemosyne TaxID=213953 RepID=A0AAV1L8M7_9NEOP
MGNLPPCRSQQDYCFQQVGIDFGGPFLIKENRRRNARVSKAYHTICLFICLSVKAVHLELVSKLSTEAFLAALDRFVSRRGTRQHIVTDFFFIGKGDKRAHSPPDGKWLLWFIDIYIYPRLRYNMQMQCHP